MSPDGPDINPIENAFAKLKALLRKAAEHTREGLWTLSADSSISSHSRNAKTTSEPQGMMQPDRIAL
jgi:transposase